MYSTPLAPGRDQSSTSAAAGRFGRFCHWNHCECVSSDLGILSVTWAPGGSLVVSRFRPGKALKLKIYGEQKRGNTSSKYHPGHTQFGSSAFLGDCIFRALR